MPLIARAFTVMPGQQIKSGDLPRPLPSEQPFPSPTWEWRQCLIRRPAGGHTGPGPKARRWFRLPRRNPRDPIGVTIKLRGGAEYWVEIHARGEVGRYPGYVTIAEIVLDINNAR